MSDVILRIEGSVAEGVRAIRAFKDEVRNTQTTVAGLGQEYKTTSAAIQEQIRAQIAAEKEKVAQYRQEIAAIQEVSGAYKRGSDERKIATQTEIDLQRKLQAALGETAAVAARGGGRSAASREERDASGFARGAASRSGVVGAGLSALAGPGFLAGAVVGGVVDLGVKAAKEEQVATANLMNALRDTGNARATSRRQLEEYAKAEEHATGFTRDQVMQTLSMLIRSTGSLTTARKDEAVMANIARARQTDLSGAYMLVVKASEGNVGALRRLGIDVQKVTTYEDQLKDAHVHASTALKEHAKQLDLAATKQRVMAEVTRKFAGDSASYMHTFGGATAELKNEWRDFEVEIGTKAIPILTNLFGWIEKELQAARTSHTVHKVLSDALAVLKTFWAGLTTVIRIGEDLMRNKLIRTLALVAGGIWALNAAVEANPFAALATAAILAVGLIEQHWSAISGWFDKLWGYIKDTGRAAWAFIVDVAKSAVYTILQYATAGIQGILEVASHLPFVGHEARRALDSIQGYINQFKPDFSNVVNAFGGGGAAAGNAFAGNAERGIAAAAAGLAGGPGTSSPSVTNARGIGGGVQFGIVTEAKRLGVGSGGTYRTGGGHGGVAHPGTMLDCSGYVFQVFTQAGFKGFPGTSETQWATHSGPNWTSVVISASEAKPGDVVFMVGSPEYPSPGHVGIVTDGAGMGATVMQYYQTGMPPDTIRMSEIGDLVGVKRFYLGVKQAATAPKPPASPTAAADASLAAFKQELAAAPSSAKAKGPKGLSVAGETTLLGSITALLGTVPKGQLDSVEREAIAQIRKIKASIHVGMTAEDLAKDKVELAKWGKNLRDEIAKNAAAGRKAAAAAAKELRTAAAQAAKQWNAVWTADTSIINRQISESWAVVQKAYDRETQKTLQQMSRSAQVGITGLQRAFQAQMTQFDRATQTGLAQLAVAQTPEEKALADFQAGRAAAQLATTQAQQQSDLAAAIASGDPAQIKSAQDAINSTLLDIQEAALQKDADLSRKAQDAKTAEQQQAYQDARDALKQSLTDQEQLLEQSYQDTADAAAQAYQDQRDAQWIALNDQHDDAVAMFNADLKDWGTWIVEKKKTWAEFLQWMHDHPVGTTVNPDDITGPNASVTPTVAIVPGGPRVPAGSVPHGIAAHAAGGIHWRPSIGMLGEGGPEATFPLSGQRGQAVVQQLAEAIAQARGGGGGTTVYGTFLGATERQVGRALANIVTPQQARVVKYRAPI